MTALWFTHQRGLLLLLSLQVAAKWQVAQLAAGRSRQSGKSLSSLQDVLRDAANSSGSPALPNEVNNDDIQQQIYLSS
jgi:hypothetical protein